MNNFDDSVCNMEGQDTAGESEMIDRPYEQMKNNNSNTAAASNIMMDTPIKRHALASKMK